VGVPRQGVYLAWTSYGSPVSAARIAPTRRVTAVDGVAVADLDAFIGMVRGRPAGAAVRLTTEDLDGRVLVQSVVMEPVSWPTEELRATPEGWVRSAL